MVVEIDYGVVSEVVETVASMVRDDAACDVAHIGEYTVHDKGDSYSISHGTKLMYDGIVLYDTLLVVLALLDRGDIGAVGHILHSDSEYVKHKNDCAFYEHMMDTAQESCTYSVASDRRVDSYNKMFMAMEVISETKTKLLLS